MLREYQQRAIDQLYAWFANNSEGNPCLVMPTGSGKSHVIAALCKDAIQTWPETRVFMLTHVKELIEQNAEKMRLHWRGAPMGIYSSSLKKRQLGEPITFAGIQSVRKKAKEIGFTDLVIIDECHLVSHKDEGGYRHLLSDLKVINPAIRIIGLTASPYRLGHGLITDKPALFDALIEPVKIEELMHKGFLAPLRSKLTDEGFDLKSVHKRGGEYIESELQAAVNNQQKNINIVKEIVSLAQDRQHWLLFCTGVDHAKSIAEVLNAFNIPADCVTGDTPMKDRDRMIADFKSGKLKALTNANVLTTGFDYPDIDLIAMLRPTMSASLYVQMAGRGLRPKSHTDHCLVLDFAGVVATHGPITAINPSSKPGTTEGSGDAPVKVCDNCQELVHISLIVCPACGNPFPVIEKSPLKLRDDDIMGIRGRDLLITGWEWRVHTSVSSQKLMIKCTYYGDLSDKPITEYFTLFHDGYAGQMAWQKLYDIASSAGANLVYAVKMQDELNTLNATALIMNSAKPPSKIEFRQDGKFFRVLKREWICDQKNQMI